MARHTRTGNARPNVVRRVEGGFTYLGLMLVVAAMGAALAATAQVWATIVQREKEVELLFIGDQFRKALSAYAGGARNANERTPRTLNDLVKDPRHPDNRRYLRQIYIDPMTGKREWGLQKDTKGGIVGVFSLSEAKPLKVASFAKRDRDFEGKTKYAQWIFLPAEDDRRGFAAGQGGKGPMPDSELRPAIDADIFNQFLKGGSTSQGQ
ncbi:MAG TPA: hypothetical protein PLV48_14200 [Rhodocyclaceae bacterium]|nr:hypothetical protein [Rhodocyclaceae bacterium]